MLDWYWVDHFGARIADAVPFSLGMEGARVTFDHIARGYAGERLCGECFDLKAFDAPLI
jgi:hypothetical protein